MNVKIFISTYKDYELPDEPGYMPIFSGASVNLSYCGQYQGDNTGDNISDLNDFVNELDVMYWGWKNVKADIKGLCHHRRYIGKKKGVRDYSNLLTANDVVSILGEYDVIVPTRRKFYIMNSYVHYVNSKANMKGIHKKDLETIRDIVKEQCPDYLETLDIVYHSYSAYMLNMFVAKTEIYDTYCEWLFPIIFEFKERIKAYRSNYSRCGGAMGEFLMGVYFLKNRYKIKEMPILERENLSLWKRIKNRIRIMIMG